MSRDSENAGGEGGHETAALGEAILSRLQAFRARGPDEGRSWFSALASSGSLTSLVLLAFLSALSGTAILYILNSEAQSLQDKSYSVALALLFVAVIVVQRYTERVAVTRAAAAIERALHAWRIRISGKVVSLSLRDLESLSRGRVQDGLARYYEQLSQTVVPLVSGFESLILLAFMLVYLFFLSPTAALLASGVAVVLAAGYLNTARSLKPLMMRGAQADAQLSRLSEGMVAGFK